MRTQPISVPTKVLSVFNCLCYQTVVPSVRAINKNRWFYSTFQCNQGFKILLLKMQKRLIYLIYLKIPLEEVCRDKIKILSKSIIFLFTVLCHKNLKSSHQINLMEELMPFPQNLMQMKSATTFKRMKTNLHLNLKMGNMISKGRVTCQFLMATSMNCWTGLTIYLIRTNLNKVGAVSLEKEWFDKTLEKLRLIILYN